MSEYYFLSIATLSTSERAAHVSRVVSLQAKFNAVSSLYVFFILSFVRLVSIDHNRLGSLDDKKATQKRSKATLILRGDLLRIHAVDVAV